MSKTSPTTSSSPSSGLSRNQIETAAATNALIEFERRKLARERLVNFIEYTKPDYQAADAHRAIAQKLEGIERGEIKRLMIFTYPRLGKSEIESRRFPAWYMGKHPTHDFISGSYGSELANDFGRDVRNIVASREYSRLFPQTQLSEDSQAKDRWHTEQGGSYLAAGVGSAITGRGAHILNIDDPIKGRADAESQQYRDAVWNWYRAVAYTRLAPGGAVVLTMTRWHEDDLAGRLLAAEAEGTGDRWEKLIIPALLPNGESACPERFSTAELLNIRSVIGPYDWASLYEQRPRPLTGSFFSESSLLDSQGLPLDFPINVDSVYAIIDTAVKTGKQHDGVGVEYFARNRSIKPPLTILDWDVKQMEGSMLEAWLPTVFQTLEELAKATKARMGIAGVWIEDKASGMVLIQQAQKNERYGGLVHAIPSKLSSVGKAERAINVSGYVHAGHVKITRQAYERVVTYKGHTKNHLMSQVLGFRPGTKDMDEDDLLDCFSYGVALGLGDSGGF